jgi:very-short-patch-repair endonuclease
VGEGGASRSEATGEGFEPQTPHHRPTAKRIRNFAKKMRREPTDAEADMWRLALLVAEGYRIARYWNNDVLQQPSQVLEDILERLAPP